MIDNRINVLVVDRSAASRAHLVHILASDPQIVVQGAVRDGQSALDCLRKGQIEVILLDVNAPCPDGFEIARRVMENRPVPIVICSGTNFREVAAAFDVLNAGAVACVERPTDPEHVDFEPLAAKIRETVKLMSEVRVVRRWIRKANGSAPAPMSAASTDAKRGSAQFQLIGIGASTGGPPVLQEILAGLPNDFAVPILVVQHIASGFIPGLAEWLNQTTGFPIHIAAHGTVPLPGHVYLAPDNFHMGINARASIHLSRAEPEGGMRPAVSHLFRTLAEVCGENAVGVLLTGMGRDGAAELKLMRDRGAVTIAQDRESSVVHGMPGEAIALGGATHVVAASKIASALLTIVNCRDLRTEGQP